MPRFTSSRQKGMRALGAGLPGFCANRSMHPDLRRRATGKRKRAVARVILARARAATASTGARSTTLPTREAPEAPPASRSRWPATAPHGRGGRIHGGGVSAQAGALRHGVARALVEADPACARSSTGAVPSLATRAPRSKKAGLKKARKRPQFSKRERARPPGSSERTGCAAWPASFSPLISPPGSGAAATLSPAERAAGR